MPSTDICPVCLEELELRGGRITVNPGCGHSLHIECYTQYTKKYDTCSVCKKPLTKIPEPAPAPVPVEAAPNPSLFYYPPSVLPPLSPYPNVDYSTVPFPPYPNVDYSTVPFPPYSSVGYSTVSFAPFAQQNQMPFYRPPPPPARRPSSFPSRRRDSAKDDDDPVLAPLPTKKSSSSPSSASTPPVAYITLVLRSEHPSVTCDEDTSVICMASLEAPTASISEDVEEDVRTQGTDLVMVLDVSGSMSGSKIELLKNTLRYVLTQLSPQDRVSLVSFSSDAKRETPLFSVSEARKESFESAIQSMITGGGTNIGAGLKVGLDGLLQRITKNPSAAIFLLSDGQDNEGHGWQGHSQNAKSKSIPIHTFGYGNDADSKTLSAIAEITSGTFNHIAELQDVQHCFAGALGGLLALGYQNLSVVLRAGGGRSTIKQVLGSYPVELDAQGAKAKVNLGDLYYGEKRDVLVELVVHKLRPDKSEDESEDKGKSLHDDSQPTPVLVADCAYDDLARKESVHCLPTPAQLLLLRYSGPQRHTDPAHPAIQRQRMRLATASAITSAVKHAENRKFDDAQRVLTAVIGQVQATIDRYRALRSDTAGAAATGADDDEAFYRALIDDLNRNCDMLKDDQTSYSGGGIAWARKTGLSHRTQRANYRDSPTSPYYQAPQSQAFETRSRVSSSSRYSMSPLLEPVPSLGALEQQMQQVYIPAMDQQQPASSRSSTDSPSTEGNNKG